MEFTTKSPQETKDLGKKIADNVIKEKALNNDGAVVVALSGELGSGKTVTVQGIAEYYGIEKRIVSPTFILMKRYEIPTSPRHQFSFDYLYHLDLYRLEENIGQELKNLGIEDVWKKKDNLLLIEWADKAKGLLPKNTIYVDFEQVGENERNVIIS